MKKIITLFIFLLMLSAPIVSCDSKEEDKNYEIYDSLVIDITNDGSGAKIDAYFWSGMPYKKEGIKSQSIDIQGKKYTGSYKRSIDEKLKSYTTDVFCDENKLEYGVKSGTNEIAFINYMTPDFFNTEPYLNDISNSKEYAISYAEEVAKKFVDNIDDYTMIFEEPRVSYKEKEGKTYSITYYVITYAKKISGYFSSDFISIKITSKGHLASVYIGDSNAFSDVDIVVDDDLVNKSISNKVYSAFKDTDFKVNRYEIDLNYQRIAVTPDGRVGIYSKVDVIGTNRSDASNTEYSTSIVVFTVLHDLNMQTVDGVTSN